MRIAALPCAALLLSWTLLPAASAADAPRPPCSGQPSIPLPAAANAPAAVRVWQAGDLPDSWLPPACLGWSPKVFAAVTAVAGRMEGVPGRAELLRRLLSVSQMTAIRYWSATRRAWRRLYAESYALSGPDESLARADFAVAEARTGKDYFVWQKEASASSGMVLRMRFRELSQNRIVVAQANVSPARVFGITALAPGGLETVHFLERERDGIWRYYSLTRVGEPNIAFAGTAIASSINRLVAIYRYLASIPTDRDPPAAP